MRDTSNLQVRQLTITALHNKNMQTYYGPVIDVQTHYKSKTDEVQTCKKKYSNSYRQTTCTTLKLSADVPT